MSDTNFENCEECKALFEGLSYDIKDQEGNFILDATIDEIREAVASASDSDAVKDAEFDEYEDDDNVRVVEFYLKHADGG